MERGKKGKKIQKSKGVEAVTKKRGLSK